MPRDAVTRDVRSCCSATRRVAPILCVVAFALIGVSCGTHGAPAATTAAPLITSIATPTRPSEPLDPTFKGLPDATAYFGHLGRAAYQIELPHAWNGSLVMYIHGSQDFGMSLSVEPPPIRQYLVSQGYAWAASSFDRTGLFVREAADQTADLWQFFKRSFRAPEHTYVIGASMGGAGAAMSAERYGDQYDGALALCPISGVKETYDSDADFLVAAAYAAGVTQAQFETTDVRTIWQSRIRPALQNADVRARFEDVWTAITGGPRMFAAEGLDLKYRALEDLSALRVQDGLADNSSRRYVLRGAPTITNDEFNEQAVRIRPGRARQSSDPAEELTGNLQIPLLTITTTGDALVPLAESQDIGNRVNAVGAAERLVQRSVQAPEHCGFVDSEIIDAFAALVSWARGGTKPPGEDLSTTGPDLGRAFTRSPRLGSPAASALPGAADRRVIAANIEVRGGGQLSGPPWVVNAEDSRLILCELAVSQGLEDSTRFEWTVAGDAEIKGCGRADRPLSLLAWIDGRAVLSDDQLPWPGSSLGDGMATSFSPRSATRHVVVLFGAVVNSSYWSLPAGTIVQAYVGDTLCGVTSIAPTGEFAQRYLLLVSGPDIIPSCLAGRTIDLRVNGGSSGTMAVNDPSSDANNGGRVDIIVP